MVYGIWYIAYWYTVYAMWYLEGLGFRVDHGGEGDALARDERQELWCMVYGICYMVHGVWYMVYGIWYMIYGI